MEFNLKSYKSFIELALSKDYKFLPYINNYSEDNKIILLRHDIDADPSAALAIAELEYSCSIRSTFFFMVRSPLYNLFSRSCDKIVRDIIEMEHHIGLHFDAGYICNQDIQSEIDRQIEFLNNNFRIDISAVSFHQPDSGILNNEIKIRQINTYDKIDMKGFFYISDTNMGWKKSTPIDLLNDGRYHRIQLLIHPLWWVDESLSTIDAWDKAIVRNFNREQQQIILTERAFGVKRYISIGSSD